MKTLAIKTSKAELLILELPEGTISYQYSSNLETISAEVPNDKGVSFKQSRIKKGYTLLGTPDEIKESDARMLVHKISFGFKNYKSKDIEFFLHPKESLLSLIETEIHWDVNPLSKPRWDEIAPLESWNDYQDAVDEWHKAEKKTFDRNRTLIFKKATPKI